MRFRPRRADAATLRSDAPQRRQPADSCRFLFDVYDAAAARCRCRRCLRPPMQRCRARCALPPPMIPRRDARRLRGAPYCFSCRHCAMPTPAFADAAADADFDAPPRAAATPPILMAPPHAIRSRRTMPRAAMRAADCRRRHAPSRASHVLRPLRRRLMPLLMPRHSLRCRCLLALYRQPLDELPRSRRFYAARV